MSSVNINFKNAFNKKRLIAVFIVLMLVVVMIVSNPDVGEFFSSTDALKLDFQTGVEYDIASYDNEMLIANNEGVFAIDKSGRESWSVIAPTTVPELLVKGRYFMLADIHGKTVRTYKKEKQITQIEIENEILAAKMNKNGYIALATDELGYKGMVVLYGKDGKERYRWHSGSGYIGDIDISDNERLAVAQINTDKDKVYSKIIIMNPNSKTEPECIAEIEGLVIKLLYRDNGSLTAVSDKGIYSYSRFGNQKFAVDLGGRKPLEFNIENENNMVLSFDSGLNSTVLESYSSKGKLRGSYDAKAEILATDVNGEYIALAKRDGIVCINPKGNEKKELKASRDVKDIKLFSGRDRLLSLGGNSAEIMKVK